MRLIHYILIALTTLTISTAVIGCNGPATKAAPTIATDTVMAPLGSFSADSAMQYARHQVAFGPRTPGSEAHDKCTEWLAAILRAAGADTVMILGNTVTAWDGNTLPIKNVFARFAPEATARIILLAHYDTRPWADQMSDEATRDTPIDGANDGASGVAVLLEVARNLGMQRPDIGVDILLTDCEDYGARSDARVDQQTANESWCLGARDFADNMPYTATTLPRYGILLDMVGGRGARFNREYLSATLAPQPTARVWSTAAKMGLAHRFPMSVGGAVTDDHLPLIEAGIPVTDIIESAASNTGSFPATWHTTDDNIDNIDPEAMADAGRVVLNVIYTEKP